MSNTNKVLVVDDSKVYLQMLLDKLSEKGMQISQAKDGQEGLDKALAEKPDLVILDVVMPGMDGFAMLEKLRSDSWGENVPVVMLSGLTHPRNSNKAKTDKNLIYLVKEDCKPDDIAELSFQISQMLQYMTETNLKISDVLVKAKQKLGLK